jgi:3-oxoacyl-[acyl-carrier protein] reductase
MQIKLERFKMDLKDKVVLVTGGSLGIGYAIAEMAKNKGAKIIIVARNRDRLDKAAKELSAFPILSDVGNEDHVRDCYDLIMKEFGRLDVLVNNAGYGYFSPVDDFDKIKFEDVLNTNVIGAALMAKYAARVFKKQNSGNIVNISSTAGTKGFSGGTPYVATKFALKGMSECWRAELREHNVRVIHVNPSEVQTHFAQNAGFGKRDFNDTKLIAEDIAHSIISALEMNDRGFITELTVFATNPK